MATVKDLAAQAERDKAEQAEVNSALLGALQGIGERLDSLTTPSGVTVEAPAAPAPAKPSRAKKSPTAPNRFTPAATSRMVPVPTTVGETVTYVNKAGDAKSWKIAGIGPCTVEGVEAEQGACLANRVS